MTVGFPNDVISPLKKPILHNLETPKRCHNFNWNSVYGQEKTSDECLNDLVCYYVDIALNVYPFDNRDILVLFIAFGHLWDVWKTFYM